MIYNISSGIHKSINKSFRETIEADTEEEARKIAEKMIDKLISEVLTQVDNFKIERPTPRIEESDANWKLKRGAIYLVRYYKKYVPAVVYHSERAYYSGDKAFSHEFKYLSNGKFFVIYGKNPERLGKKLCNDGTVINKPECATCVARFYCFTNKGVL